MVFEKTSVGIDIGAHTIKVVQLSVTERGAFIDNALYFDRASLAAPCRGHPSASRALHR